MILILLILESDLTFSHIISKVEFKNPESKLVSWTRTRHKRKICHKRWIGLRSFRIEHLRFLFHFT